MMKPRPFAETCEGERQRVKGEKRLGGERFSRKKKERAAEEDKVRKRRTYQVADELAVQPRHEKTQVCPENEEKGMEGNQPHLLRPPSRDQDSENRRELL